MEEKCVVSHTTEQKFCCIFLHSSAVCSSLCLVLVCIFSKCLIVLLQLKLGNNFKQMFTLKALVMYYVREATQSVCILG